MSRPEGLGVPYFPLVTEWDQKLKLIQAKYKLKGIGCIVELLKATYAEGYALRWDEDAELLFSDEKSIPLEELREIVGFAVEKGIFDRTMLVEKSVLTSHGIQKQWLAIVKAAHRKITEINPGLCLLSENELEVEKKPSDRSEKYRGNEATAQKSIEETPQSKAKQSKVNSEELASLPPVDNLTEGEKGELFAYVLEFIAKKNPKVRRPAKWAQSVMTDPAVIAEWRAWKAEKARGRGLPSPTFPCSCGGEIRAAGDRARCVVCGRFYDWDRDTQTWKPDESDGPASDEPLVPPPGMCRACGKPLKVDPEDPLRAACACGARLVYDRDFEIWAEPVPVPTG